MSQIKYIYLDTSRLLCLADSLSNNNLWINVDRILRCKNVCLLLSVHHLYEFSKYFGDNDRLGEYLDTLPNIKWIVPSWTIWQKEIENALNFVLTGTINQKFDLIFDDFADTKKRYKSTKMDLEYPKNFVDWLKLFRKIEDYKKTEKIAQMAIKRIKQLKENALIWQSWHTVLGRVITQNWPVQTANKLYMVVRDPDLIQKVINESDRFMPGVIFNLQLQKTKYRKDAPVEVNDLFDEYHASYAPYVDLIMHDKKTYARVLKTKSQFANRFTDTPAGFMRLIRNLNICD